MYQGSYYRQPQNPQELKKRIAAVSLGGLFGDMENVEDKIALTELEPPVGPPPTPSNVTMEEEKTDEPVDPSTMAITEDLPLDDEDARRGAILLEEINAGKLLSQMHKSSEGSRGDSDASMGPLVVCLEGLDLSIIKQVQDAFDLALERSGNAEVYPAVTFVGGTDPAILSKRALDGEERDPTDEAPDKSVHQPAPGTFSGDQEYHLALEAEWKAKECLEQLKKELMMDPLKRKKERETRDLSSLLTGAKTSLVNPLSKEKDRVAKTQKQKEKEENDLILDKEMKLDRFNEGITLTGKYDKKKSITFKIGMGVLDYDSVMSAVWDSDPEASIQDILRNILASKKKLNFYASQYDFSKI